MASYNAMQEIGYRSCPVFSSLDCLFIFINWKTNVDFSKYKRKQAYSNLLWALKHIFSGDFIHNGVDSCYDPCCIFYYAVRLLSMNIWGIIFGNYGWFWSDKAIIHKTQEELQHYLKTRPSHVLCWWHKLSYKNKTMTYHRCDKCDWIQFKTKECKRC
jgi:hypothetical protein